MIFIIFWFTNFSIKLTLVLFLRYSYNLGDIHLDIFIEAILIKKADNASICLAKSLT